MTEQAQSRLVRHRLAVLRHAEEVAGNVAATCRYYGISRQCFYKWRRRYDELGEDGLRDGRHDRITARMRPRPRWWARSCERPTSVAHSWGRRRWLPPDAKCASRLGESRVAGGEPPLSTRFGHPHSPWTAIGCGGPAFDLTARTRYGPFSPTDEFLKLVVHRQSIDRGTS